LRYQDDILILCNTKRQLNRCKCKMMQVMHERHLRLSKRKTRIGEIAQFGFHFLGIEYPPTRTEDNTKTTPVKLKAKISARNGGKTALNPGQHLNDSGGWNHFLFNKHRHLYAQCTLLQMHVLCVKHANR